MADLDQIISILKKYYMTGFADLIEEVCETPEEAIGEIKTWLADPEELADYMDMDIHTLFGGKPSEDTVNSLIKLIEGLA